MSVVWENLKAGMGLKVSACLKLAGIGSGLWVIVMATIGFDMWARWYIVPMLMWVAALGWWAFAANVTQSAICAMPLSFMLPGYRLPLRKLSLLTALPAGVAGFLVFIGFFWSTVSVSFDLGSIIGLNIERENATSLSVSFWGGFKCSILLIQCLGGVAWFAAGMGGSLSFSVLPLAISGGSRNRAKTVTPLLVVSFLVLPGGVGLMFPLIAWPIALALSLCVLVFIWVRLGDVTHVTQCHRAILGGMSPREQLSANKRASLSMERFFLGMMERCRRRPACCHIWGSLYYVLAPMLSRWRGSLFHLPLLLVCGLLEWPSGITIFLMFATVVLTMNPFATLTLPLPVGRRERFSAMVVLTIVASFLLAVLGVGLTLFFQTVLFFIPSSSIFFRAPPGFATTCLPALLTPGIVSFILLIVHAPSRRTRVVGPLVLILVLLTIVVLNASLVSTLSWDWDREGKPLLEQAGLLHPVLLVGSFMGAWICFLLVLRYVLSKGSLAKPTPRIRRAS